MKQLLFLFLIAGFLDPPSQVIAQNNLAINGQWLLEIQSNDIGMVNALMTFEIEDGHFHAFSRKGADREILGFWTSSLGRIFTDDFKKEIFKLSSGFSMIIPTADYYTANGFRIDQKGVEPNIKVPSEEALEYVMDNLIEE